MGFKFRYQAVLDYRHHLTETAAMKLAQAQRQLAEMVARRERLQQAKRKGEQTLAQRLRKGVSGRELQLWRAYLSELDVMIAAEKAKIEAAGATVRELRKSLLEADCSEKALSRLRDRHHQEWNLQQLRLESKLLDAMAVARNAGRQDPR